MFSSSTGHILWFFFINPGCIYSIDSSTMMGKFPGLELQPVNFSSSTGSSGQSFLFIACSLQISTRLFLELGLQGRLSAEGKTAKYYSTTLSPRSMTSLRCWVDGGRGRRRRASARRRHPQEPRDDTASSSAVP